MKLKYYGTSAAEGIPALYCVCDICKHARKYGGKNVRTRSQAMVDDTLLIDFPADTYLHVLRDRLPLESTEHVIITHAHPDHLYPHDFDMRKNGFMSVSGTEGRPLHVYGMPAVRQRCGFVIENANTDDNSWLIFHDIKPFTPFMAGEYRVTPLPANHDPNATPVIFIIEKDGKTMLYGNDTGYFFDEVWEYLERNEIRFDLVSLDSTMGFKDCRNGHMGVGCVREVFARLTEMGAVNEDTVRVAHHFTHNAMGTHEDFETYYGNLGILTSYDGMEVEF